MESEVRRGPVGPAVSSEALTSVDVPGLCQIVLTVGLCPEVAVVFPVMWDPLFASSPVETLKMTVPDVVRRICAVVDLDRTLLGPVPWWTLVLRRIVPSSA